LIAIEVACYGCSSYGVYEQRGGGALLRIEDAHPITRHKRGKLRRFVVKVDLILFAAMVAGLMQILIIADAFDYVFEMPSATAARATFYEPDARPEKRACEASFEKYAAQK